MTKKSLPRDMQIYPASRTQYVLRDRLSVLTRTAKKINSTLRETGEKALSTQQAVADARAAKIITEQRQNLLNQTIKDIISDETPRKSIFISYSGHGQGLAESAIKLAKRKHFFVRTGFDAEVQLRNVQGPDADIDESLPRAIMAHIQSCDCFLGIWTGDFDAESIPGIDVRGTPIAKSTGLIPSVWMPFELGVAASHDIPFRLLIQKGTHKLYYEKPFHNVPAMIFATHEFDTKIKQIIDFFDRKIQSKKIGP